MKKQSIDYLNWKREQPSLLKMLTLKLIWRRLYACIVDLGWLTECWVAHLHLYEQIQTNNSHLSIAPQNTFSS